MNNTSRSRALTFAVLGILAIGLGSPACRKQDESKTARKTFRRIALVGIGKSHPTWPVLEAVATLVTGRKQKLEITVLAPEAASPQGQINILESLIRNPVDVVCLHPADPVSVAPVVESLMRHGTPVVAFGTDLLHGQRSAYAGPAEGDIGRAGALAADRLVHPGANTAILLHAGGDDPFYSVRYNSLKAALAAAGRVSLLKEIDCRGSRLAALELVRTESRKYPRVAGFVLLDDWPLRALSAGERLLPEGRRIILCSSDPTYHPDLRDGRIDGMLAYDYREAAVQALYEAIRLCQEVHRGYASVVGMPVEVLTRENLEEWRLRWLTWERGQPSTVTSLPED